MYLSAVISSSCPPSYMAPLQGDTYEMIRTAKEIGFKAVEIHIANHASFPYADVASFCAKEGISIPNIGTGLSAAHGVNLTTYSEYLAEYSLRAVKQFIDGCRVTGARLIIGSIKGRPENGDTVEKFLDRLHEKLLPVLEYCARQNVRIVLEAINRYETPIFNTLASTAAFIKRLDTDIVSVHSDTFHMNIEEPNMLESLRACGRMMGHIHFADNVRHYCGSGSIDFKAVVDTLYEIGYEGPIAFEHLPGPDGADAIRRSYEHISPMLRG